MTDQQGSHKTYLDLRCNQSSSSESSMTDEQAQGCPEEEEELEYDEGEEEGSIHNLHYYLPLHQAAREGDWAKAKEFIDQDPEAIIAKISITGATALHVAATYGKSQFVKKMVEIMPIHKLAMQDCNGLTVLHLIATSGTVNAAKVLVEKNSFLTQIINRNGCTPLEYLCRRMSLISLRETKMLWYLCQVTRDEEPCFCFSKCSSPPLFILNLLASGHFDVCLYLLQRHRELAKVVIGDNKSIEQLCLAATDFRSGSELDFFPRLIYKIIPSRLLYEQQLVGGDLEDPALPYIQFNFDSDAQQFSEMPFTMQSTTLSQGDERGTCRVIWEAFIKKLIAVPRVKEIFDIKLKHKYSIALLHYICQLILQQNENDILEFYKRNHIIHSAARNGIVEIVAIFLRYFPDLMRFHKHCGKVLLQNAVENRREKIFNLLMELSAPTASFVSNRLKEGENILHLAAKLAPSSQLNSVSGPALQMQRELQWFKEVEKLVSNRNRRLKNKDNKTPQELFTEEHKELRKKGEDWMRNISSQCLVVTTLIATIAFAAAFTVPEDDNKKAKIKPKLYDTAKIYSLSANTLALFFSVISLLMFLAILNARYAEEDFLLRLPRKMIFGFSFLFFAIASMLASFEYGLFTLSKTGYFLGVVLPLTFLSLAVFQLVQVPMLLQMVRSTYGRGIFYRPGDHIYRDIAYKKIN